MVHIRNFFVSGFKLYWYDGIVRTPHSWKKGLLLRDHEDKGVYTVRDIFFVAREIANLLTTQKIPFLVLVRQREGKSEIDGLTTLENTLQ